MQHVTYWVNVGRVKDGGMIKVPRDKKEGLWMLCLQPACDREEDITGYIIVSRQGNIRSYRDNMREFRGR